MAFGSGESIWSGGRQVWRVRVWMWKPRTLAGKSCENVRCPLPHWPKLTASPLPAWNWNWNQTPNQKGRKDSAENRFKNPGKESPTKAKSCLIYGPDNAGDLRALKLCSHCIKKRWKCCTTNGPGAGRAKMAKWPKPRGIKRRTDGINL